MLLSRVMKKIVRRDTVIVQPELHEDNQDTRLRVLNVIYGWGAEIERSGVDFFAHKRGFSAKSLSLSLEKAGFVQVHTVVSNFEVRALAFKMDPTAEQRK